MNNCCPSKKKRFDWLLWGSLTLIILGYGSFWLFGEVFGTWWQLSIFGKSVFEIMNRMAWGLALGIVFVGILQKVPRELLLGALGKGGTFGGILRATAAGVMLDLCSHGVLIVGMQLYKKGASLGQMVAFLVASPWNSLSLTLVLWALIGFKWMMMLLVLSMVIAVISGWFFDVLVRRGVLPANPNTVELPKDFRFWKEFGKSVKGIPWQGKMLYEVPWNGLKGSRMILRWILFGVVLAALIRTFIPPDQFGTLFGPTLGGLGLTLLIATILEVCSEGSAPVAADILNIGGAPGNAFGFLMTGVSTDYTEILTLRETTGSWKIALFLPLVTLPQIVVLSILMNQLTLG